jgi:LysM repeat protein
MSHQSKTLIQLVTAGAVADLRAHARRHRELIVVFGLAALQLLALFTALALHSDNPTAQATSTTLSSPAEPPPAVAAAPHRTPGVHPSTPSVDPPAPQQPVERSYLVRPGDTLASVALRHGVDYRRIAADNQLADPNRIHPGQRLLIGHPTPGIRLIRPGDTLIGLATATGLTVRDLLTLNPWITNPDRILAGAGLRVRV